VAKVVEVTLEYVTVRVVEVAYVLVPVMVSVAAVLVALVQVYVIFVPLVHVLVSTLLVLTLEVVFADVVRELIKNEVVRLNDPLNVVTFAVVLTLLVVPLPEPVVTPPGTPLEVDCDWPVFVLEAVNVWPLANHIVSVEPVQLLTATVKPDSVYDTNCSSCSESLSVM
jgi:hypothetical protein